MTPAVPFPSPRPWRRAAALVLALAACERATITNPPGPVATFQIAAPPPGTTYRVGDTLDLRRVITSAADGYGRPVAVASLRPRWAVTHASRGAPVSGGEGFRVPVPAPNADGRVYVLLWVVADVPPDGTAEAGFAISVAPE